MRPGWEFGKLYQETKACPKNVASCSNISFSSCHSNPWVYFPTGQIWKWALSFLAQTSGLCLIPCRHTAICWSLTQSPLCMADSGMVEGTLHTYLPQVETHSQPPCHRKQDTSEGAQSVVETLFNKDRWLLSLDLQFQCWEILGNS